MVQPEWKDTPYHTEWLYALIQPVVSHGVKGTSMCYVLGRTAQEVWQKVIEEEALGSGHTRETLKAAGWRARRIYVEEK